MFVKEPHFRKLILIPSMFLHNKSPGIVVRQNLT